MGQKETREVSLCLVGVRHDVIEEKFYEKFSQTSRQNELIFWERMRINEYEGQNYGYDDSLISAIEFVITALCIKLFDNTKYYSGHGAFLPFELESASISGSAKAQAIFDAYSLKEQMLVSLFVQFWHVACNDDEDSILKPALEKNRGFLENWNTLILKVKQNVEYVNCWIQINENTLTVTNTFLDDFMQLLIDNRKMTELPIPIKEVGELLYKINMSVGVVDIDRMYGKSLDTANMRIRDYWTLTYILQVLEQIHRDVTSVIVVVGTGHVKNLHRIIDDYNTQNRDQEILYFNNIVEILSFNLKGNFILDYTQKNAYVNDMIRKITHWRDIVTPDRDYMPDDESPRYYTPTSPDYRPPDDDGSPRYYTPDEDTLKRPSEELLEQDEQKRRKFFKCIQCQERAFFKDRILNHHFCDKRCYLEFYINYTGK
jgi:hypothetical protein